MIDFLSVYGMFLAKLLSVVIVLALFFIGLTVLYIRSKSELEEHLDIKHLNQKYEHLQLILNSTILDKKELKQKLKAHKKDEKKKKNSEDKKNRIFVIHFKGDIRASEASSLCDEITAILTVAEKDDEVLVVLESAGGTVHGYGYAASQLNRIKEKGISLTVAVDKVAASGGYMMACIGHKIIAAPFAIIGSIGVLAQIPNFNKLLKKHNIDYEQISAGKHKRTITLFGENTDEDRQKLQEELEETHKLFKDFVKSHREQVDIEKIATGEHWYGTQALELNLVDLLSTSDDYLCKAADQSNIYEVNYVRKKPFSERLFSSVASILS